MTEPQMGASYEQILKAARFADREGLHSFARSDHLAWSPDRPMAATDAFATMGGLARDTDRVRLCVLVTPITFRHPAIIAKNAATIDQMSEGRFDLGVGTGWNEYEHRALGMPFPGPEERWDRLVDAIGYLKAAFGEGRGTHSGRFYELDLEVHPKPTGIRLIVGGSGPKRTPTLAGAEADEYNFFLCPPEEARAKIEVMREAAGGREVEVTAMGQVRVAANEPEMAGMLEEAARRRGLAVEDLVARWEDSGQVFGTPGLVREKLEALEEAGVERVYLQWLDLSDYEGLARMVELVRT